MSETPLKNLLPTFIKDLSEKGRSPATTLAYRADLEQFMAFSKEKGKAFPQEIKPDIIEAFRDTLLAQKYTPKSVSRKLNAIKTFFRYLLSENHITTDVSAPVAHPKVDITPPKFLSALEYRALRDVVRQDSRVTAILELMLQTGARISEVSNFKLANIGSDKITIEAYAAQPQRTTPLNSRVKADIDNYLKDRPKLESEYLFVSKNGKPLAVRNIRASIDRYMQKAGITGFSVNDLRTTFIVYNLKAGVDIVLLSQVAGHRRISTTERYLELAGITEPGKKQTLEEL